MTETAALQTSAMQPNRRHRLFRLWLVGTLVILMGTGFILRPDRDAAQYLKYQHVEIDESDLQSRRLVTQIRFLRGEGLASDQIKDGLLSNGFLTKKVSNKMIELTTAFSAKQQAEKRLTLFAAIALVPSLIILELGAALFWVGRGYKAWTNTALVWPQKVIQVLRVDWVRFGSGEGGQNEPQAPQGEPQQPARALPPSSVPWVPHF